MKEIIILRGLPFSGKTTWAEKFKKRREECVSLDIGDIIETLEGVYHREERWVVVKEMLTSALQSNHIVIIDDVNILSSSIKRIMNIITFYKLMFRESVLVSIQEFHTPYQLCVKRAEQANADERELKMIRHYYNHCLRRKIIYNDEENS